MCPQTILILSANPKGTPALRLDEEVREIKAGLERSPHRDLFRIEQAEAVTPRDVQRAMLKHEPQNCTFLRPRQGGRRHLDGGRRRSAAAGERAGAVEAV